MSDALRHIAIEFHALHSHAPYNIQTFNNCEHNICIEARQALAAAPPAVQQGATELLDAAYQRGKQEGIEAERERIARMIESQFVTTENATCPSLETPADRKILAAVIRSNSQGQGEKK